MAGGVGEADGWKERGGEGGEGEQQHNGAFIRFVRLLLVSDLSI